jgi:hypothetical protein
VLDGADFKGLDSLRFEQNQTVPGARLGKAGPGKIAE